MTHLVFGYENETQTMCYLRVALGSEDGCTGLTLYEIDRSGWVHRQVQIHADGVRFAPEDVLMCRPVNLDAMRQHDACDEIESDEFEMMWSELEPSRRFFELVPDANLSWSATYRQAGRVFRLRWEPTGWAPPQYTQVPGFTRLFVHGDQRTARSACAALFVEKPIAWVPRSVAA